MTMQSEIPIHGHLSHAVQGMENQRLTAAKSNDLLGRVADVEGDNLVRCSFRHSISLDGVMCWLSDSHTKKVNLKYVRPRSKSALAKLSAGLAAETPQKQFVGD